MIQGLSNVQWWFPSIRAIILHLQTSYEVPFLTYLWTDCAIRTCMYTYTSTPIHKSINTCINIYIFESVLLWKCAPWGLQKHTKTHQNQWKTNEIDLQQLQNTTPTHPQPQHTEHATRMYFLWLAKPMEPVWFPRGTRILVTPRESMWFLVEPSEQQWVMVDPCGWLWIRASSRERPNEPSCLPMSPTENYRIMMHGTSDPRTIIGSYMLYTLLLDIWSNAAEE